MLLKPKLGFQSDYLIVMEKNKLKLRRSMVKHQSPLQINIQQLKHIMIMIIFQLNYKEIDMKPIGKNP